MTDVRDSGSTGRDSGTAHTRLPSAERPGEATGPHGAARRRRTRLRWAALGASALVLLGAGVAGSLYHRLDGNIRTDTAAARELERYAAERPAASGAARNILLLGSDTRGGANGAYGKDDGGQRADTAILLHLAGDRRSATGVSIPRDLMVPVPSCTGWDGNPTRAELAQFNGAFERGGAACSIRTLERLTGVRVDHHLVIDFSGFTKLVDAVDGVEICLPHPVEDRDAKLSLPAGRQTLGGAQALGYVRARHGIGNGSDTERMERQQRFLGSLVKKVRGDGLLHNPVKVYPVLDAATSALTGDSGLDSLKELYELMRTVRDIPEDQFRFLTVPRRSYPLDTNRDELVQPEAGELFALLRNDTPPRVGGDRGEAAAGGGDDGGNTTNDARGDAADAAAPGSAPAGEGATNGPSNGVTGGGGGNGGSGSPNSGDTASTYDGTTAARDVCDG
ncbi:LytR family transcriptional regulator [Streptomyces sp. AJS327]|uniref:LCP family protein n=1 Tax=Streptomyces sp. AJS327 TaxID=2545265 RepID=UPI0015DDB83B|nr:LCP family protein [Streptomyces sp. AJS327]MBA0049467.1 LytR family transcriptional regulator [Streptomyces sp. AJS327]